MTPTGIIELSIGLGAAAIIIDKVLSWTIKWKGPNGSAKTLLCYQRPETVLHNQVSVDMKECLKEIAETQRQQTLILQHLADVHDQRG